MNTRAISRQYDGHIEHRAFRTIRVVMKGVRHNHGGAAVELVIVFPILLLLIIGVVDYGRTYYTSVVVANAARAAAEYGAQGPWASGDTVKVRQFGQLDGADAGAKLKFQVREYCECGANIAQPSCLACPGGSAPDVFVEVTAIDTVSTLLPYPGLPTKIVVRRSSTFRMQ